MQKLYFEAAWDKTIAPKDRENIELIFQEQAKHLTDGIHFSFLRQAKNHKGELLVIVLIHNGTRDSLSIQNTVIAFFEEEQQIATGIFSLPCEIIGKTTMPWTFIFSQSNQTKQSPQYIIINE